MLSVRNTNEQPKLISILAKALREKCDMFGYSHKNISDEQLCKAWTRAYYEDLNNG